jgi:hypothetical protein
LARAALYLASWPLKATNGHPLTLRGMAAD